MSNIVAAMTAGQPGRRIFGIVVVIWLIASVAFFVATTFVDEFLQRLLSVLAAPALFALYIVVPACAIGVAFRRLSRHEFRAAAFAACVPVIAFFLLSYGPAIGIVIRFAIERPAYVARIEAVRAGAVDFGIVSGSPIVAFFPWGGTAVGSYGVVYDESNVIAKPLAERQAAWRYRGVPGELLCDGDAWRLSGHFYIGHFAC
jgi:uncharacterized membrane protein YhaH (DUF805 family)